MAPTATHPAENNRMTELVEAFADRQAEMDLRIEHLSLHLPNMPGAVEMNGLITLSVHFRDMSDEEKRARAAHDIKSLGD